MQNIIFSVCIFSFSNPSSAAEFSSKRSATYLTCYDGLPLVLLQQSEEAKMNYLKGQLKNVYLNDIIDRNRAPNEEQINAIVEILASSIGSLTNPQSTEAFKYFQKRCQSPYCGQNCIELSCISGRRFSSR